MISLSMNVINEKFKLKPNFSDIIKIFKKL